MRRVCGDRARRAEGEGWGQDGAMTEAAGEGQGQGEGRDRGKGKARQGPALTPNQRTLPPGGGGE